MLFRSVKVWALLAVSLIWIATYSHSQTRAQGVGDYPNRPITIVVSLGAGTGMDVLVRLYADKLSQSLGKPVVVENKPGAATMLAAAQIATAPADGYTLGVLTSSALAINPTLYKQINYNPAQDFVPLSLYVKSPFILVTRSEEHTSELQSH